MPRNKSPRVEPSDRVSRSKVAGAKPSAATSPSPSPRQKTKNEAPAAASRSRSKEAKTEEKKQPPQRKTPKSPATKQAPKKSRGRSHDKSAGEPDEIEESEAIDEKVENEDIMQKEAGDTEVQDDEPKPKKGRKSTSPIKKSPGKKTEKSDITDKGTEDTELEPVEEETIQKKEATVCGDEVMESSPKRSRRAKTSSSEPKTTPTRTSRPRSSKDKSNVEEVNEDIKKDNNVDNKDTDVTKDPQEEMETTEMKAVYGIKESTVVLKKDSEKVSAEEHVVVDKEQEEEPKLAETMETNTAPDAIVVTDDTGVKVDAKSKDIIADSQKATEKDDEVAAVDENKTKKPDEESSDSKLPSVEIDQVPASSVEAKKADAEVIITSSETSQADVQPDKGDADLKQPDENINVNEAKKTTVDQMEAVTTDDVSKPTEVKIKPTDNDVTMITSSEDTSAKPVTVDIDLSEPQANEDVQKSSTEVIDLENVPDAVITVEDSSSDGSIVCIGSYGGKDVNEAMEIDGVETIEADPDPKSVSQSDSGTKRKIEEIENDYCEEDNTKKQKLETPNGTHDTPTENCHTDETPAEDDYVVVSMSDVPSADSTEITEIVNHISQTNHTDTASNPLFKRKYIDNPHGQNIDEKRKFSIISYNILADHHFKLPEDASQEQITAFSRKHRHEKLMAELEFLDGDIVCLQEVDPVYYADSLKLSMDELGYCGHYQGRLGCPEGKEDGCATFYKEMRFTSLQADWISLSESAEKEIEANNLNEEEHEAVLEFLQQPDIMLIDRLQCRETGMQLTVGNIHVGFMDMEYPNVQALQIACAFHEVLARAQDGEGAHIITGDFNQTVGHPGYTLAKDGSLGDDMIRYLQGYPNIDKADGTKCCLVDLLWKSFRHTSKQVKSAYLAVQETEPSYTTTSKDDTVDYIFFSSPTLQNTRILTTPDLTGYDALTHNTPTLTFHSDHLSLKADFAFK